MSAQEIAGIVFIYNSIFDAMYLSSLFVSLMLVAYGVYRLIKDLART